MVQQMAELAPTQDHTRQLNAFDRYLSPLARKGHLMANDDFLDREFTSWALWFAALESGARIDLSEKRAEARPRFMAFSDLVESAPQADNTSPSKDGIAFIPVRGVMRMDSSPSTYGANDIAGWLRQSYANSDVKAIVLEVASGGGEAEAGNFLNAVLQERNKPVIAYATEAQSAAYSLAIGADEIHATHTTASFGSIGTLARLDKAAIEEYRNNVIEVYATKSKKKNKVGRALRDNDTGPLQQEMDAINESFISAVESAREIRMRKDDVFAGETFDAVTAKRIGLIDAISTQPQIIQRAMQLAMRNKKKK